MASSSSDTAEKLKFHKSITETRMLSVIKNVTQHDDARLAIYLVGQYLATKDYNPIHVISFIKQNLIFFLQDGAITEKFENLLHLLAQGNYPESAHQQAVAELVEWIITDFSHLSNPEILDRTGTTATKHAAASGNTFLVTLLTNPKADTAQVSSQFFAASFASSSSSSSSASSVSSHFSSRINGVKLLADAWQNFKDAHLSSAHADITNKFEDIFQLFGKAPLKAIQAVQECINDRHYDNSLVLAFIKSFLPLLMNNKTIGTGNLNVLHLLASFQGDSAKDAAIFLYRIMSHHLNYFSTRINSAELMDKNGSTALHTAAFYSNIHAAKVLKRFGAQHDIKDHYTPPETALEKVGPNQQLRQAILHGDPNIEGWAKTDFSREFISSSLHRIAQLIKANQHKAAMTILKSYVESNHDYRMDAHKMESLHQFIEVNAALWNQLISDPLTTDCNGKNLAGIFAMGNYRNEAEARIALSIVNDFLSKLNPDQQQAVLATRDKDAATPLGTVAFVAGSSTYGFRFAQLFVKFGAKADVEEGKQNQTPLTQVKEAFISAGIKSKLIAAMQGKAIRGGLELGAWLAQDSRHEQATIRITQEQAAQTEPSSWWPSLTFS